MIPYSRCKWCTVCNVPVSLTVATDFCVTPPPPPSQIISEVYLQSHERGRSHQEAVSRLPKCHTPLIVTLDEERGEGDSGSKGTPDQVRAGRKRGRKLRQRMATRSLNLDNTGCLLLCVCVCVCVCRWREQQAQWHDGPAVHSEHKPRFCVGEGDISSKCERYICLVCRLQRCLKEVSRLMERCSGREALEKAHLQQLDRSLSEVARTLAGKVSWRRLGDEV